MRVVRLRRGCRAPSRAIALTGALALTLSGCAFAEALADPEAAARAAAASSAAVSPSPIPVPVPPPPTPAVPIAGPVVIASGDLALGTTGGMHLTVTAGPLRTGHEPPIADLAETCGLAADGLQYLPVDLTFTDRDGAVFTDDLAGRLTVTAGPDTPADLGRIGVFFQNAQEPYCQTDPPVLGHDRFWSHGNRATTAYVVVEGAVTATTPDGLPEVWPTLQVQLDDLRAHGEGDLPYGIAALTIGGACSDDPDALCMPLQ